MNFGFCELNIDTDISKYDLDSPILPKNKIGAVIFKDIFEEYECFEVNEIGETYQLDINDLLKICIKANIYFGKFVPGINKYNLILNSLYLFNKEWIWDKLSIKPDYNKCLLSTRYWPYFNNENKQWKTINIDFKNQSSGTTVSEELDLNNDINFQELETLKTKNNFSEYKSLPKSKYKIPDMNLKFAILTYFKKNELYDLLVLYAYQLLTNPDECHIIKYSEFWNQLVFNSDKYNKIIFNGLYYALYILRHEETIMLKDVDKNSRCIFKLNECNILPSYPVKFNIENNPYIQQISDSGFKAYSCPSYLNIIRQINNEKEANLRFNIITKGIFDGIDFKELKLALTGSILIPCVSKTELENNFDTWNDFLEYYYPSTKSLKPEDYKKYIKQFDNKEMDNKDFFGDITDLDVSCSTDSYDIDTFIKIKDIFVSKLNENLKKQGEKNVKIIKVRTVSQFKFVIYVPGLDYHIELFRISYHPSVMTKNFHLPNVKMWWDGEYNLWSTCIMTLMGGINNKYKWFSCNKTPADVIMKYVQRGFTTILNKNEKKVLEQYLKCVDEWKDFYISSKIFGPVHLSHPIFNMTKFKGGIRMNLLEKPINITEINYQNQYSENTDLQLITYTDDLCYIKKPNFSVIKNML